MASPKYKIEDWDTMKGGGAVKRFNTKLETRCISMFISKQRKSGKFYASFQIYANDWLSKRCSQTLHETLEGAKKEADEYADCFLKHFKI